MTLEAPLLKVVGDVPDKRVPERRLQWTPFERLVSGVTFFFQDMEELKDSVHDTRNKVFTQEKGSCSKQGMQQIAVVITEDVSQDRVSGPASLLHRAGVIIAVGTQMASERTDLKKMALYTPRKHVISLESLL
ncbi:Collagen Alpha-6(Vi) Chain [Manis pentadactyla]|nr:Collagen Alpha-6(Vi) Chain [Manis pentadactyla]